MASAAGRKNKTASQSTSLHQQCSALRSRLLRIHGFAHFFALSSPPGSFRGSADVVNTVWDCFALGIPLCYLFNLLPPPITPIDIETDPLSVVVDNEHAKKRAIALFAIRVKQLNYSEQFTVTDLWGRTNLGGFVKVVRTVTNIVNRLPPDVFGGSGPTSPPAALSDAERNNIIRELVETERKYVQVLEVMQKYAQELSQSSTLDHHTIHLLFPNLNNLLIFQRRFSIRLEETADIPWREQRWGLLFTDNEEEFAVYEPYCVNYTNASDLMLMEEQNLVKYNYLINAKLQLPAFRLEPIQRICFYPSLLDRLLKKSSPFDYPHYEELKAGSAAAKRITDKIGNAHRRAENLQTVQNLTARVDDWKGYRVSQSGALLLDGIFTVTKSEVDCEYYVFLFECIILCCKEDTSAAGGNNKNAGKGSSPSKKTQANGPLVFGLASASKKKMTPLLLKGRIYLNNVTDAKVVTPGSCSLTIWWNGFDELEFLTLRCRNEVQVKQWETAVKRLIEKAAIRRESERSSLSLSRPRNGTHDRGYSTHLAHVSPHTHPYANGHRPYRDLDDNVDDYSVASSIGPTSGGITGGSFDERHGGTMPGLDHYLDYEQPRAHTEDVNDPALSQWRGSRFADDGSRNGSSFLGDHSHIGSSRSSLDTIGPPNDENLQRSPYRHPTHRRNDSLRSSTSSLDTIRPHMDRENPQLHPYPSSTDLQSNGSLCNASFMTSPSYDSLPPPARPAPATTSRRGFHLPTGGLPLSPNTPTSGLTPSQADHIDFETCSASYSDDELNSININSRKLSKEERRRFKDNAWVDILVANHSRRAGNQDAELAQVLAGARAPSPVLDGEILDMEPMIVPHRSKIDSLGSPLEEQYAPTIPESLDLMEPEEVPGVDLALPPPQRRMGYFDMHPERRRLPIPMGGDGDEDIFDQFARAADAEEENDDPPRRSVPALSLALVPVPAPAPSTQAPSPPDMQRQQEVRDKLSRKPGPKARPLIEIFRETRRQAREKERQASSGSLNSPARLTTVEEESKPLPPPPAPPPSELSFSPVDTPVMGQEGELEPEVEEGGEGDMEPPNFDFDYGRESPYRYVHGAPLHNVVEEEEED